MAYTTGDAAGYSQEELSASSVVSEQDNEGTLEATRATEAETAGVTDARFIGYTEVLQVYENRSDVETMAHRRARENGLVFDGDQDFVRENWDGDDG